MSYGTLRTETVMQTASGQHNPIGQGGSTGDAKRMDRFEEEDGWNTWKNDNLWED